MGKLRMIIALSLACAVVAGCGSNGDGDGSGGKAATASGGGSGKTYVVATTVPFPPYTDRVNGKFVGIEKDLISAIADAQGFQVKIENAPKFESLIPGMLSGRYDGAYDAFGDNPERHKQFKTVDWLGYRWGFVGRSGAFTSHEQLCGKRVAVQAGSQVMIDALTAYSKQACGGNDMKQVPLPLGQQTSAVKSGRADAMVTDTISLPGVLKKTPQFAQIGESYGDPVIGGLLVPAKNAEFADQVVAGLKKIVASGQYKDIMAKWDVADAAYDKATVNLGE